MNRNILIDENSRLPSLNTCYQLSLTGKKECREVFQEIGKVLSFEIIPHKSWDAFLDQFREFCSTQDQACVLILSDFKNFSKADGRNARKLIEIMVYAIKEHYRIVENNKTPLEKRIHENKDINIYIQILK